MTAFRRICALYIALILSSCAPVADGLEDIAHGFRSFGDDVEHAFEEGTYKATEQAAKALPRNAGGKDGYASTVRKVRGGSVTVFDLDTPAGKALSMAAPSVPRQPVSQFYRPQQQASALPGQGTAFHELAKIYFGHGSAQLDTKDRRIISDLGMLYQKRGGVYNVEGHASERAEASDPVERQILNLRTSMHRAVSVSEQLIREGVPVTAIKTTAHGSAEPAEATADKSSEEASRRVEIYGGDAKRPMTAIVDRPSAGSEPSKGYIPKLLRDE